MNEKVMEQAAAQLMAWLQSAGETVAEQAPLLAHEITMYTMVSNGVGMVIGAAIVAGFLLAARWCWKNGDDEGGALGLAGCTFLAFFMFWFFLICANEFCKAAFAPRYLVIETLLRAMK